MNLLITTQAVDRDDPGYFGFFHAWVAEFARYFDQVTVICLREGAHNLPDNVRVFSLGKERGRPLFGSATYAWRFLRLAWRLRRSYDAVFVHMNPEYAVLAGLLWRLMHKRIVLWYVHRSVDLKLRVGELFVNNVVTTSPESFRLPTSKLSIVGHGIDPMFAPTAKSPSETLRIIYWGRLSPSKQIEKMLAAVHTLQERGVAARLMLVGAAAGPSDAGYVEDLKKDAARLRQNSVIFAGGVPHRDVPKFLAEADVCVNISTTQSMDKTVLEAMAAGLPVVSSNDAFKEVLSPYGFYIADPGNADVVADAILKASKTDAAPLIEYVRQNHSLGSLVPKIVAILKGN